MESNAILGTILITVNSVSLMMPSNIRTVNEVASVNQQIVVVPVNSPINKQKQESEQQEEAK